MLTFPLRSGDEANRQAVASSYSCHVSNKLARAHDKSRTHAKRLIRCALIAQLFIRFRFNGERECCSYPIVCKHDF